MPPCGIRTHSLSRRAAADLRFRPRGHWDRQYYQLCPWNVESYESMENFFRITLILTCVIFHGIFKSNKIFTQHVTRVWLLRSENLSPLPLNLVTKTTIQLFRYTDLHKGFTFLWQRLYVINRKRIITSSRHHHNHNNHNLWQGVIILCISHLPVRPYINGIAKWTADPHFCNFNRNNVAFECTQSTHPVLMWKMLRTKVAYTVFLCKEKSTWSTIFLSIFSWTSTCFERT